MIAFVRTWIIKTFGYRNSTSNVSSRNILRVFITLWHMQADQHLNSGPTSQYEELNQIMETQKKGIVIMAIANDNSFFVLKFDF